MTASQFLVYIAVPSAPTLYFPGLGQLYLSNNVLFTLDYQSGSKSLMLLLWLNLWESPL